ncbi:MAG: membrane protein insertion efficiency factor YidD [Candidatus Sungbacteria bacterium GWC2_49_10]|uniref:Membrane protein insertion efficiency factor YidD n=1 Tax=Candidatus Sungbacteria bacterium GWC2_49_10 TaxID=1802263 RepID=A0A1G2K1P0_9BACT|nr:MAG: membrane protein insertion efficiency factor YidD [Candidatus Sungbacteria bacterium GWC2_49_10]
MFIQSASVLSSNAGCRYFPSCSEYARTSVSQYGLFRGSVMSLTRVASCNPFSRGGYDPVPRRSREKRRNAIRTEL